MHQPSKSERRPMQVIVNPQAGTAKGSDPAALAESLSAAAAEVGAEIEISLLEGQAIGRKIDRIKASGDAGAVIVGGGDGTVSTTAAQLAGTSIALGVLPLGTMNFFARALKIPLDPALALKSLLQGEEGLVDTGSVNGRLFLHQVSLGLQPHMIRRREAMDYGSRLGKMVASARAFLRTMRRPPSLRLEATAPNGESWCIETPALIVSNNLYDAGLPPLPLHLDQGILGVYILASAGWTDLLSLSKDIALGQWQRNAAMDVRELTRIAISRAARRAKPLTVSIDGELDKIKGELDIAIQPKSLKVLKPRAVPEETAKGGQTG